MQKSELPNEVKQVLQSLKDIQVSLKNILAEIKVLKDNSNYKDLVENRKKINEWLYLYMSNNNLEEVGGIKISKVMPSKERKERRKEEKKSKVSEILASEFQDETEDELDELVNKITEVL